RSAAVFPGRLDTDSWLLSCRCRGSPPSCGQPLRVLVDRKPHHRVAEVAVFQPCHLALELFPHQVAHRLGDSSFNRFDWHALELVLVQHGLSSWVCGRWNSPFSRAEAGSSTAAPPAHEPGSKSLKILRGGSPALAASLSPCSAPLLRP